jgi:hypothetical protein
MPVVGNPEVLAVTPLYCTVAEARTAGATGTDDEVEAAILAAQEIITTYTGELFASVDLTVSVPAGPPALLPYRVQSVSAVRAVGSDADTATTSYRVTSSSVIGEVDAVEAIGGGSLASSHPYRITVTGTFGYADTPAAVTRACALIAAHLTKHPEGDDQAGVTRLSVEGYSVDYGDAMRATTGVPEADRLLRPYRFTVLA